MSAHTPGMGHAPKLTCDLCCKIGGTGGLYQFDANASGSMYYVVCRKCLHHLVIKEIAAREDAEKWARQSPSRSNPDA